MSFRSIERYFSLYPYDVLFFVEYMVAYLQKVCINMEVNVQLFLQVFFVGLLILTITSLVSILCQCTKYWSHR